MHHKPKICTFSIEFCRLLILFVVWLFHFGPKVRQLNSIRWLSLEQSLYVVK